MSKVNLVERSELFIVTFSLANYCHEFESMLELAIPTIDKFIPRNDLLLDMMNT